eukprot:285850-Pelagomonas_calceolata.AAC.1
MALPLSPFSVHGAPFSIPRSMLCAHTSACNRCDQEGLQHEKHAVFLCSCAPKQTNDTHRFISDLVDVFCAVGTVEKAEQPNYLAEGQTSL